MSGSEAHPTDEYDDPNEVLREMSRELTIFMSKLSTIEQYESDEERISRPILNAIDRLKEAHLWVNETPSILNHSGKETHTIEVEGDSDDK